MQIYPIGHPNCCGPDARQRSGKAGTRIFDHIRDLSVQDVLDVEGRESDDRKLVPGKQCFHWENSIGDVVRVIVDNVQLVPD